MQTSAILSLSNQTRLIPPAAAPATTATGFRVLKGRVEEAAAIAAAEESAALKEALTRINDSATPFFTVGCGKTCNTEEGGTWARGYLDVAFNHIEIAKDSPNYFLLFEQFNRHILDSAFDLPVDFNFQLKPAHFMVLAEVGYTACVWITTAEFEAGEEAEKAWNQSIGFLKDFLCSFEKPDLPVIY